jgi:hypothetical protein
MPCPSHPPQIMELLIMRFSVASCQFIPFRFRFLNTLFSNTFNLFQNTALWRMFGQKRDKVTGSWKRLCNEELHNLYSSPKCHHELLLCKFTTCEIQCEIGL